MTDLERKRPYPSVLPHLICADGYRLSVQASRFHYCSPREDWPENGWSSVEVQPADGVTPEGWEDYDAHGVFGWVPLEKVRDLIQSHGGLAYSKKLEPLAKALEVAIEEA